MSEILNKLKAVFRPDGWKLNEMGRAALIWFAITTGLFLFHQPVSAFLSTFVFEPVFGGFVFGPMESWALIVLVLFFAALSVVNFRSIKHHPRNWVVNILLITGTGYILYRFFIPAEEWSFYHFHFSSGELSVSAPWNVLLPGDVMLLVFAVALYYKMYHYRILHRQQENRSIFSLEVIKEQAQESDDRMRRVDKAEFIAQQIIKLNTKSAFAIGIVGSWGSGKTHFIKQVTKHLPEKDINVIWFTPWEAGSENITQFFLRSLYERLSGEVSAKLSGYAKWLQRRASDSGIGTSVMEFFSTEENPHEEVNKAIIRSGKKNVVILDDIDRLEKKEILEVCRIIRNTADFHNTVYIMAYDKDYVVEALEDICGEKAHEYLGKIIQFQYYLPKPPKHALMNRFADLINETLLRYNLSREDHIPDEMMRDVQKVLKALYSAENIRFTKRMMQAPQQRELDDFFNEAILTVRDVYTFQNSYILNLLEAAKFEIVDAQQLFLVEILKLKSSRVYMRIRNKELIVPMNGVYTLHSAGLLDSPEEYLPLTIHLVHEILMRLFGNPELKNGITSFDHFDWYFDGNTNLLRPKEREELRTQSGSKLKDVVQKIAEQKEDAITEYLHVLPVPENSEEFERHVDIGFALFEVSPDYRAKFTGLGVLFSRFSSFEGMNTKIVLDKLTETSSALAIDTASLMEFWLLGRIEGQELPAVPPSEQLQQLLINILEQSIQNNESYAAVSSIYRKCISIVRSDNAIMQLPKANELMREFVKKTPLEFVLSLTMPVTPGSESHALNPYALQIFDSYSEIQELINSLPLEGERLRYKHWLEHYMESGPVPLFQERFRIFSDLNTVVKNGDQYRKSGSTDLIFDGDIRKHEWLKDTSVKYLIDPLLANDDEANKGGVYTFVRTLDIRDSSLIKNLIFRVWADDFVKIEMNGSSVLHETEGFHIQDFIFPGKGLVKNGDNEIIFFVRNRSAEEHGRPQTWKSNPYALAYQIDFVFK